MDYLPFVNKEEIHIPQTHPPYPLEFRQRVVELHRAGRSVQQLADEFEPSEQTIRNWIVQAHLDEGIRTDGLTTDQQEELGYVRDTCNE